MTLVFECVSVTPMDTGRVVDVQTVIGDRITWIGSYWHSNVEESDLDDASVIRASRVPSGP